MVPETIAILIFNGLLHALQENLINYRRHCNQTPALTLTITLRTVSLTLRLNLTLKVNNMYALKQETETK